MCGRFTLKASPEALAERFGVAPPFPLFPRFNVAPTQGVPALLANGEGREWAVLRWGLVPSWATDKSIGARLLNARAETAASLPSFRSAFKSRRCLVPADGFFEWAKVGGRKQPYYFTLQDGGPFAFAGLWEEWKGEGEPLRSCAILTTEANDVVRPVHERMPVILAPDDYARWLGPAGRPQEELLPLLRPLPAEALVARPVSPFVNSARNEGPRCVEPVASEGLLLT
jgi:putative SOS response-associated peptidase YedK